LALGDLIFVSCINLLILASFSFFSISHLCFLYAISINPTEINTKPIARITRPNAIHPNAAFNSGLLSPQSPRFTANRIANVVK